MKELLDLFGFKKNKKDEKKDFSAKQKILFVGLIPVFILLFLAFLRPAGYSVFLNRQNISQQNFTLQLINSTYVDLITDLRGLDIENQSQKQDMRALFTCTVGFAQSSFLAQKNLSLYTINQTGCIRGINESLNTQECIQALLNNTKNKTYIWITYGNISTKYLDHVMLVSLNSSAKTSCSINSKQ